MRIYYAFLLNAFQSNLAYKTDVFLRMFGRIMALFVQVAVWIALFHHTTQTETSMGMIDLDDMITYVVISTCISVFITTEGVFQIGDRIRSGEIAVDLMKPIHLHFCLLFQSVGGNISRILFELLPLFLITLIVFPFQYPTLPNLLLFLFALFNGFLLNFILSYIVGLIGFWYLGIYHLFRLLGDLIKVFSGAWIPLWFFPGWLADLSAFLPFRLIFFTPISIFLGKIETAEAVGLILQQFMWMGLLSAVTWLMWRKGITKLVIQGG
ncbi:ABC transporter permease [Paenibacillus senegalensis]|uniref:ABC transporter permease n=1 Tax=Paenibacillus senegalensis TaxID=1465766 RepID=UPI000288B8DE|nr:ABC-2 family transporter protein [Paenibacillus senegalensis]